MSTETTTAMLGVVPDENGVAALPNELDTIARALAGAADACEDAATRILPRGARHESFCTRHARAADAWPVLPPPSRERVAALLTSLHDAAATARRAAAQCDDAKHSLDAALHPSRRSFVPRPHVPASVDG